MVESNPLGILPLFILGMEKLTFQLNVGEFGLLPWQKGNSISLPHTLFPLSMEGNNMSEIFFPFYRCKLLRKIVV
jgi:hypothetical protein